MICSEGQTRLSNYALVLSLEEDQSPFNYIQNLRSLKVYYQVKGIYNIRKYQVFGHCYI